MPNVNISSYSDGQSVPDNILQFNWTYSDANSQVQTAYQIQGSQNGFSTVAYDSGTQMGAATSFTTLPLGSGSWSFRILVNDGLEWSNWVYRNNLTLPNSFEPNDAQANATPIQYNQNYTTLIGSSGDVDFFKFTATKTGLDRISLTVPSTKNYDIHIYDASMKLLASGIRGTGSSEEQYVYVTKDQIYYIKVIGSSSTEYGIDPYILSLNRFGVQLGTQLTTTYQYDFNGNITGKQTTIN